MSEYLKWVPHITIICARSSANRNFFFFHFARSFRRESFTPTRVLHNKYEYYDGISPHLSRLNNGRDSMNALKIKSRRAFTHKCLMTQSCTCIILSIHLFYGTRTVNYNCTAVIIIYHTTLWPD